MPKFSMVRVNLLPGFIPRVLVSAFFTAFTTNAYMVFLHAIGLPIRETYDSHHLPTMKVYWSFFVLFYIIWFWVLHSWIRRAQERKVRMAKEKQDSIWCRHSSIMKERADKMQEMMAEYDREVYRPALKSLQQECATEGHTRGSFHDNGLGWTWYYCSKCGAQMDKQGTSHDESEAG